MIITHIIMDEINKLELHIESLRNEMIRTGLNEGLSSERTIQVSKKLDRYITKYQFLSSQYGIKTT